MPCFFDPQYTEVLGLALRTDAHYSYLPPSPFISSLAVSLEHLNWRVAGAGAGGDTSHRVAFLALHPPLSDGLVVRTAAAAGGGVGR